MPGYLFAHFTSEQADGEQIYFSISKDGLFWKDLNNGKPVLRSTIGECGARDPFIVKHPKTGMFYLMATGYTIKEGFATGKRFLSFSKKTSENPIRNSYLMRG